MKYQRTCKPSQAQAKPSLSQPSPGPSLSQPKPDLSEPQKPSRRALSPATLSPARGHQHQLIGKRHLGGARSQHLLGSLEGSLGESQALRETTRESTGITMNPRWSFPQFIKQIIGIL